MDVNAIVELAALGNVEKVEQAWMTLLQSPDVSQAQLAELRDVLVQLRERGNVAAAETLAWAAVASVGEHRGEEEALSVAGPYLVAVGNSDELRQQVSDLYRKVHGKRKAFEELLTEAGLPGGRPVRRAVRTLDVVLPLQEGSYLKSREEGHAARVVQIDLPSWEFTIEVPSGQETLGAVQLADQYEPATAAEFRVMRQFNRSGLLGQMDADPASVVVQLCREHAGQIDSQQLHDLLVPGLLNETSWKKWWTKARVALRKLPNIQLEGRSPYSITYSGESCTFEDVLQAEFDKVNDPVAQFAALQQYIQSCKSTGSEPSVEVLTLCHETLHRKAQAAVSAGAANAGLLAGMAQEIGRLCHAEEPADLMAELLRSTNAPWQVLAKIDDADLQRDACDTMAHVLPDGWQTKLEEALPKLRLPVCDWAAKRLLDSGRDAEDMDRILQEIYAAPVEHFEALLWLWDGPSHVDVRRKFTPVAVFARVLRALDEARLSDQVPHEQTKRMGQRARAVLSARKYDRFMGLLDEIDRGVAGALRVQLGRLDGLGRAVRDDLTKMLSERFPAPTKDKRKKPWELDTLFVTEKGLSQKEREIAEHINVKMRENSRAIGLAAEKGDLSENSEYKFALEERDLLRARLKQMNEEMAKAQVIRPDEVPTDYAGIGTRICFRETSNGERYEMTFLGGWDSNPEANVFNYKSPLGQNLMGKRIGDIVELSHGDLSGSYEIVELHNALAAD